MNEYEFWDELGNIFNAIVAYQHKTIEFNKRFVNPWLRLGTVFDQNNHNSEAIVAARKAIEIDQENGSNWLALGDVYFKMGLLDDAASAYAKAIELNPKLGWAYANLAFTNVTRQKYTEAVNLYVKSLELIEDDKDRSMIWNRLGNVYRKVNDYENAFIAFQMADECDGQNTGFHDQLDEAIVDHGVMPIIAEVYVNNKKTTASETDVEGKEESLADLEVTGTTQSDSGAETVLDDENAAEEVSIKVEQIEEVAGNSTNEYPSDEETRSDVVEEFVPENADAGKTSSELMADMTAKESHVENAQPEIASETLPEVGNDVEGIQPEQGDEDSVGDSCFNVTPPDGSEDPYGDETLEVTDLTRVAADTSIDASAVEDRESGDMVDKPDKTSDEGTVEEMAHLEFTEEATANGAVVEATQIEGAAGTSAEMPAGEVAQSTVMADAVGEEVHVEEIPAELMDEPLVDVESSTQPDTSESGVPDEVDTFSKETQAEETDDVPVDEVTGDHQLAETEKEKLFNNRATSDEDTVNETILSDAIDKTSSEQTDGAVAQAVGGDTATEFLNAEDSTSDTTVAFLVSEGAETYADPSTLNNTVILAVEDLAELIEKPVSDDANKDANDVEESEAMAQIPVEADDDLNNTTPEADVELEGLEEEDVADVVAKIVALTNAENEEKEAANKVHPDLGTADSEAASTVAGMDNSSSEENGKSISDVSVEPAYEEFLKNAVEPIVAEGAYAENKHLKIEPDTKNAYVWNELGNVYFNTGAYEEAVVAYSKAIELDDWFAWPYSNLALVYVQKEKYAEAILLYQRSIELFASDKDKAVTWNRLGNVYRRLTDYENAIACYQRADELDPNNATRSLRSRFSLLGSVNLEQSASVAG